MPGWMALGALVQVVEPIFKILNLQHWDQTTDKRGPTGLPASVSESSSNWLLTGLARL